MIKKQILETIEKNNLLEEGDKVIVGLSGGPDSISLFSVLMDISTEKKITVEAVHLNHKFRPKDAEEDQDFVEKFCKEKGIKCWSFQRDCNALAKEKKMTPEEAGREARYEAYATVGKKLVEEGIPKEKIKIALGQNLEDQTETILFRILRGTGIDGLGGIKYDRKEENGFHIIRPLLDVKRKDIEEYCFAKNLNPRIDKTNEKKLYTRNKIRIDLLPYLEDNFNPNIKEKLRTLGENAIEDSDYIWKEVMKIFEKSLIRSDSDIVVLRKDIMNQLHPSIRHRIFIHAFDKVGLNQNITRAHLKGADKLIDGQTTTGQIDFPKGYVIRKVYEEIHFLKQEVMKEIMVPRLIKKIMDIDEYESIKWEKENAVFDLEVLEKEYGPIRNQLDKINIRTRRGGDFIRFSIGRKKIQNLFVDEKVPRETRDLIFMVTIGNEVLWIPDGFGKKVYNEAYKKNEHTKALIVLEIACE